MIPSDPHDTEVDAARAAAKIKTKLQGYVLDALGNWPMTDEELEELPQFRHYGPTTVSKRRTEVYQMGKVTYAGFKRLNHRRFKMKVWQLNGWLPKTKADQEKLEREGWKPPDKT